MAKKDLLSEVYALPYAAAYERLKAEVPHMTKAAVLDFLPRIPYIPERLPPGSTGEKVHAAAAELVLARTLELLGLRVLVPRRKADQPDVVAQGVGNLRAAFDAKCVRLSRTSMNVKDAKVHKLDEWRSLLRFLPAEGFVPEMRFIKELPWQPPERQFLGYVDASPYDHSLDDRDEVEQEEDDMYPDEESYEECPLSGMLNRKDERAGAVLVVPYLRFVETKSRVNEECCDLDVTILAWEHFYALLLAEADDRVQPMGDLWHLTRLIRDKRQSSRWKDSLFAEEDELLSSYLSSYPGRRVKPGNLRDGLKHILSAERALLLAEQSAVKTEAAAVAKMDVAALRAEVLRLRRVVERRAALEAALGPFDEWLGGR